MGIVFGKNKNAPDPREIERQTRAIETKNYHIKKGNDTMKNTNKGARMEILKQNGVDTSKFFSINLSNIPVDTPVTVDIGGIVYNLNSIDNNNNGISNEEKCDEIINDFLCDNIGKEIINNSFVFNSRTDGRFVVAQTFKMLNERSWNNKTKEYEYGWDAYLRNDYDYMYQFTMMKDELNKLAKMERRKDIEFENMKKFFTKEVVVATCKHYMKQLKKYIKTLSVYKCKGKPYVYLGNPFYNVFLDELQIKVYNPLEISIKLLEKCSTYHVLKFQYEIFMKDMVILPYETPKCSEWKDAFKGKGAYMTLLNLVKFHDVKVHGLNMYSSLAFINDYFGLFNGNYWRFHELLKEVIKENKFDLKKSIEQHKN